MKYFAILACLIVAAIAQRPDFAGSSPKGVPELATRFKQNGSSDTNIVNRFDNDDRKNSLPIDARGDVNLVDRINTWPKENRPFWYVNSDAIDNQRGRPSGANVSSGSNTNRVQGNPNTNQNGGTQNIANRFADTSSQGNRDNSFLFLRNGQLVSYVYDPVSDSWVRSQ